VRTLGFLLQFALNRICLALAQASAFGRMVTASVMKAWIFQEERRNISTDGS